MKPKKKKNTMSREIRRALKKEGGVVLQRGEWERNRPVHLAELRDKDTADKHKCGTRKHAAEAVQKAIVTRVAEGATWPEIQREFGVVENEIQLALKHRFMDGKTGAQKLKDLLLANSLQLAVQTRVKAKDMNGMQSAVATGIMTSKFIELDKHLTSKPQSVDIDKLSDISESLDELTDIVRKAGIDDSTMMIPE